jgi:hypothetical protein
MPWPVWHALNFWAKGVIVVVAGQALDAIWTCNAVALGKPSITVPAGSHDRLGLLVASHFPSELYG